MALPAEERAIRPCSAQGYLAFFQEEARTAATYWRNSLQTLWQAQDLDGCAHSLVAISLLAVDQEQPLWAARFLGAADALEEQGIAVLGPMGQVGYRRASDGLASVISREAFSAAQAEGRTMMLEHIIAEALRVAATAMHP